MNTQTTTEPLTRDEAITRIRTALKHRSGKTWSVKGGRGTAHGWIQITAPPARCNEFGSMTEADRQELQTLLGVEHLSRQGESVPASSAYRTEFVHRAEHGTPGPVQGKPYWD